MNTVFDVPALQFPVEADLILPGSKSHSNRAIICACFSQGTTIIRNATPCDDVLVMVENLQKMKFQIQWIDKEKGELKIIGGLPQQSFLPPSGEGSRMGVEEGTVLDCHNAGTALRFLVSVAALVPGDWTLTGDAHMQKRPIGDLVSALRSLGAEITDTNGCPPIRVKGGSLKGSVVRLNASMSSQYLTSLLLIAPMLPSGLTIELDGPLASESYMELTLQTMMDYGFKIERKLNTFIVQISARVPISGVVTYDVEGDWSAAGSWLVLNELSRSRIRCVNLHADSTQADRSLPEFIVTLRKRGDITIDCSSIPDQVMNLAVLAAFRNGKTTITGAKNLRHKECDRLAVITSELKKVGVLITEHSDGVIIVGNSKNQKQNSNICLDPHDDHRMAMCFSILGLKIGAIGIKDPHCTAKSYPAFFDHLVSVTASPRPIVIVGMRGAGKSSLGRRLAAKLKLKSKDSDHVFVEKHGPIKEYIAAHGWAEFREKEEQIIEALLTAGSVVSLGGGATESKKTRSMLKGRAVVIWVQATKAELLQRLESGKRPAITGLPLHEEVHKLLVERAPNYKEVATIMIPPKLRYSAQVPFAVKALRALVHSDSL